MQNKLLETCIDAFNNTDFANLNETVLRMSSYELESVEKALDIIHAQLSTQKDIFNNPRYKELKAIIQNVKARFVEIALNPYKHENK